MAETYSTEHEDRISVGEGIDTTRVLLPIFLHDFLKAIVLANTPPLFLLKAVKGQGLPITYEIDNAGKTEETVRGVT